MKLLERLTHAMRRPALPEPRPGLITHRRKEDTWREYPADGLTPSRLVALFKQADAGDLSAQLALFEQMEEKDAHLFSVANTRRLAITGLHWEIVSAAELPGWRAGRTMDRGLADEVAAYCDETLRNVPGIEESLAHLSLAIGRNLALVELVWQADENGVSLAELVPVDFSRLTLGELDDIRILTDESKFDGISLPPDKFIVHTPHTHTGHIARGGMLRATALAYLGKHFALKDWLIFAEIFGMPVRIARYSPTATPEEKRELLDMLKNLGADATGVFSKAVELEIIQSRTPGEVNLYENICIYFDREISKAWLGQTLTTDTTRMLASSGAAKVHDQVRKDIRDDDLRKEAQTLRRDLLSPLVRMRFGPDAPMPYFQRILDPRDDAEKLARVLDLAVNQLGARVPARWAHASLGIPEAAATEPILAGSSAKTMSLKLNATA